MQQLALEVPDEYCSESVFVGDTVVAVTDERVLLGSRGAAPVAQFPTTARPRGAPAFTEDGACAVIGDGRVLRIVDLRDGTLRGAVRASFRGFADHVTVHGPIRRLVSIATRPNRR
jgi:hypothetical protein